MSLRVDSEPAYLLHRRKYRETSLLAEIFTLNHGRVSLVVKGAFRGKSTSSSLLQPFQSLIFSWSGKSELKTLTHVERIQKYQPLASDRLLFGLYLNELLIKFTRHFDPHTDLYSHYECAIKQLWQGDCVEAVLRKFEYMMLNSLGYGIDFSHESETAALVDPEKHYYYLAGQGLVLSEKNNVNACVGKSLLNICDNNWTDKATLKAAKTILTTAMQYHLGTDEIKCRTILQFMSRV
ncbi:MAG: DNA repair protein RecO [Gammaproteobacteria bacterium]|nr:DNA repair protein RecO [Gammaproteobacteria bacterium]